MNRTFAKSINHRGGSPIIMTAPKKTIKKTTQEKITTKSPTTKKTAKAAPKKTAKTPPKPPAPKKQRETPWFKKPLWVLLALVIVAAIAYFAIGGVDEEVSQVEASQISELQKQLSELQAEKESEAKEEAEAKAKAAAAEKKKQQEIADLIAAAEAKAKKEAKTEVKAELEAAEAEAEAETSKDDFVSVKTNVKNLSSTRPKVAGVDPVRTTINGYKVTVGVPEGPKGRPYIGNDVPHSKFDWTDASWTRLNIFKDGHKRRGFRVISKDGEPVEEIWVLVPNNPTG